MPKRKSPDAEPVDLSKALVITPQPVFDTEPPHQSRRGKGKPFRVSGDIKVFSDTTQVVGKGGEVTTITRTRMVFNDLTITGKSVGEDHLGNFALNLFGTPTSPGMAIAAGYYQEGERRE